MIIHAETSGTFCSISVSNYLRPLNIFTQQNINKFLYLIGRVLEYVFGMHFGALVGYVCGKFIGYFFNKNLSLGIFSLDEIMTSLPLTYRYAICGAVIGTIVGLMAITIMHIKQSICNLNKRKEAV